MQISVPDDRAKRARRGSARTPLIGGARAEPEKGRQPKAQQPAIGRTGYATIGSERSALSVSSLARDHARPSETLGYAFFFNFLCVHSRCTMNSQLESPLPIALIISVRTTPL